MTLALITGGAGSIGAYTVRVLLQRGWRVMVIEDFPTWKFS